MDTTERIIKLLQKLSSLSEKDRLSATELSKDFGVSRRTIYRDITDLGLSGIPVYFDNGIRVLNNFKIFPSFEFTSRELLALLTLMEVPEKQESYPYIKEVNSIREKLLSSILRYRSDYSDIMGNRVEMNVRSYYPFEQEIFALLEEGMEKRQTLVMEYYSMERNDITERKYNPYVVFFRKHGWYTVGYCHLRKDIRNFKLDRIKSLNFTEETYEMPENFSLEEYFSGSWELFKTGDKKTDIKVKFSGSAARIVKSGKRHHSQKIEELSDGSIIYSVTLGDWKEFSIWLGSFGSNVEVLAPEELRDYMIREAEKLLRIYNRS
ncbi:MAG TPA: YafY family protein [Candidatus Eremiobacteraeota bacterium]|nr:MAG: HTH domain protein [bacterium ADurb.Bin363]HPZ06707.1 YafY family protein [Candidatus Eremiobacteraeota bacterium]